MKPLLMLIALSLSPAAREIALAESEKRDARELRVAKSSDPEDLQAINRQRVEAFYRCD